jgi:hypothetical protein
MQKYNVHVHCVHVGMHFLKLNVSDFGCKDAFTFVKIMVCSYLGTNVPLVLNGAGPKALIRLQTPPKLHVHHYNTC